MYSLDLKIIIKNALNMLKSNYKKIILVSFIMFLYNLSSLGIFGFDTLTNGKYSNEPKLEYDYALREQYDGSEIYNHMWQSEAEKKKNDEKFTSFKNKISNFFKKIDYNSFPAIVDKYINHTIIQKNTINLINIGLILVFYISHLLFLTPLVIGIYRYLIRIRNGNHASKKDIVRYFYKERYVNTVKNIFIWHIYSLLLVILPFGITIALFNFNKNVFLICFPIIIIPCTFFFCLLPLIKVMMLPYLMADMDDNMSFLQVYHMSRATVDTFAINIILLNIIFVFFKLIAAATLQIAGLLFIIPLMELSYIEIYKQLKEHQSGEIKFVTEKYNKKQLAKKKDNDDTVNKKLKNTSHKKAKYALISCGIILCLSTIVAIFIIIKTSSGRDYFSEKLVSGRTNDNDLAEFKKTYERFSNIEEHKKNNQFFDTKEKKNKDNESYYTIDRFNEDKILDFMRKEENLINDNDIKDFIALFESIDLDEKNDLQLYKKILALLYTHKTDEKYKLDMSPSMKKVLTYLYQFEMYKAINYYEIDHSGKLTVGYDLKYNLPAVHYLLENVPYIYYNPLRDKVKDVKDNEYIDVDNNELASGFDPFIYEYIKIEKQTEYNVVALTVKKPYGPFCHDEKKEQVIFYSSPNTEHHEVFLSESYGYNPYKIDYNYELIEVILDYHSTKIFDTKYHRFSTDYNNKGYFNNDNTSTITFKTYNKLDYLKKYPLFSKICDKIDYTNEKVTKEEFDTIALKKVEDTDYYDKTYPKVKNYCNYARRYGRGELNSILDHYTGLDFRFEHIDIDKLSNDDWDKIMKGCDIKDEKERDEYVKSYIDTLPTIEDELLGD